MPERPVLHAAGGTHPGLLRDQNEDRLLVDLQRGVFCVVDGVGGHASGERAAEIALELLRTRLARETGTAAERLREAITLANNAVLDAAQGDPALKGMTCVLTAAIVSGDRVTAGHVGDTRLYLIRQGVIRKLTHDHSPVGEREDAGELTETEAMRHPRRNEVYRDVGAERHAPDDADFVEIVESPFDRESALLICSDGLSDQVSSPSLRRIIEAYAEDPTEAVAELIQAANDAGGKDNVSAIVVEGEAFASATRNRPRTSASGVVTARTAGQEMSRPPGASTRTPHVNAARRTAPWLSFLAGILAGLVVGALGIWYFGPRLGLLGFPVTSPATNSSRTWRVGLTGHADVPSIAEALARATAGDRVVLDGGDYRESITVSIPVTITGPRSAVLNPPLGAPPNWTAITVAGAQGVRLSGFTISGSDGDALAVGIRLQQAHAEIDNVLISRAARAAIEVDPGSRLTLGSSRLEDNPGAGLVVAKDAEAQVSHTAIFRNGHGGPTRRAGVELAPGAAARLAGNAIADNAGGAVVGWPPEQLAALLRDNVLRPAPQEPTAPSSPATRLPARRSRRP